MRAVHVYANGAEVFLAAMNMLGFDEAPTVGPLGGSMIIEEGLCHENAIYA